MGGSAGWFGGRPRSSPHVSSPRHEYWHPCLSRAVAVDLGGRAEGERGGREGERKGGREGGREEGCEREGVRERGRE